jgi:hypothetical protein
MNLRRRALLVVMTVVAGGLVAFGSAGAAYALSTPSIGTSQQPGSAVVDSSIADKATVSGGSSSFTCPLQDAAGFALETFNTSTNPIFCSYPAFKGENPTDFFCEYSASTGALVTDNDAGFCPANAVAAGPNPTGTVTFKLYNNNTGSGTPLFTDTENLVSGVATSAGYMATATGTDYWVATYNGDSNNNPVTSSNSGEPVTITAASPKIKTSATTPLTVGATIKDTATLEGLVNAEGTGKVTFELFDNSKCEGTPVHEFTTASGISGSGTQEASSDEFTTTKTGTYFWIASYAGDKNNAPIASKCGDAHESSAVEPAGPKIKTSATTPVTVGATIKDTATLEGLVNAEGTGKVTFELFDNSECEGTPVHEFTTASGISGSGTQEASSDEFTTTKTGTYFWIASYAGDKNNAPIESECGDANESSAVIPAPPSLSGSGGGSVTPQGPPSVSAPPAPPPSLSGLSQSHRRWRLGNNLARFAAASKPPVGTTFQFTLNEAATVRFAFAKLLPGRQVNGKCVAQTQRNRRHQACQRSVPSGSLSFSAGVGLHKLFFQGRLTGTEKLKPGSYALSITATNAAGQGPTNTLSFAIVPG